jgi:hypothetical protein
MINGGRIVLSAPLDDILRSHSSRDSSFAAHVGLGPAPESRA